jgi:hypothetical protein
MDGIVALALLSPVWIWGVMSALDRHYARQAAKRAPARRKEAPLHLPDADETRLSIARFRRVIGEWALLEKRAESLARRAEALRRRGLL